MKLSIIGFILLLSFLSPITLLAQKAVEAVLLSNDLKIDGDFEPDLWEGFNPATNFYQMEPHPGEPAT